LIRLLSAAALAALLHLFLAMVNLPVVRSSGKETNIASPVSFNIIRINSQLKEKATAHDLENQVIKDFIDGSTLTKDPGNSQSQDSQQELKKDSIRQLGRNSFPRRPEVKKNKRSENKKAVQDFDRLLTRAPPSTSLDHGSVKDVKVMEHSPDLQTPTVDGRVPQGVPGPMATVEEPVIRALTEEPLEEARPAYLLNPHPSYPMIARKRGYQGKVILDVLVDENGRAREVIINESSGYVILDRAAATAVADWKFEPAKRGLIAVPMRVKVPVVFRLE